MAQGECSQGVKAMGCGSIIRGFDSRHSPDEDSCEFTIKKTSVFESFSFVSYQIAS